ncbi:membrane protein insertion efficiency factor YidD [Candidatus Uhrbacteria bacterium]|nr:membrane protein insertion efficiency factor YidD [Candidatus Uhrbacteria bacterium]
MISRIAQNLLRWYQRFLSWDHRWRFVFAGTRMCRYYPSCSDYTLQSIQCFGVVRGLLLGARRLSRCTPLSRGGVDDIPLV